ncbi:hypothetical protein GCM10009665_06350 [Kitasatospora nipponensis]|uniref:Uncharacterized protein n=1 Tax=Kitasatospora nipponensis TaxID=258049 RepID=A0ABN1VPR6_9ACTN
MAKHARAASTGSESQMSVRRGAPPPYVLGAHWLARANHDHRSVLAAWTRYELADIRVGVTFYVVRITNHRLGTAALGQLHQVVQEIGPIGPAISDELGSCVDFLVPSSTAFWEMNGSQLLTGAPVQGVFPVLSSPPPGKGPVNGRRWLVEPDGTGALTHPRNLASALRAARRGLHDRRKSAAAA